jgi:structural toxin protein (hemagglutinin/hemolysin) RtxA
MYKLCFYVPASHVEEVKNALFLHGAGQLGTYSHCAWQTLGEGQFLATAGSQPALGQVGQLEKIAEYKVEMICDGAKIGKVIAALKAAHPYEMPAYQVFKIEEW